MQTGRPRRTHRRRVRPRSDTGLRPRSDASTPDTVYRAGVDELHAQRWRLGERGRRWFDIALATALLLPVDRGAGRPGSRSPGPCCASSRSCRSTGAARYPVAVFVAVAAASARTVAAHRHASVEPGGLPGGDVLRGALARRAVGSRRPGRRVRGRGGRRRRLAARVRRRRHRRQLPRLLPHHRDDRGRRLGARAPSAGSAARTSTRWSNAASGSSARPRSRWSSPRRRSGPGSRARCTTSSPTGCR